MERRGILEIWLILKCHLQAQERSIPPVRKSGKNDKWPAQMSREVWAKLKHKYTESRSRDKYPGKNIETLFEHAGVRLGKTKPNWN